MKSMRQWMISLRMPIYLILASRGANYGGNFKTAVVAVQLFEVQVKNGTHTHHYSTTVLSYILFGSATIACVGWMDDA